jgi:putative flippase GtrA
MSAIAQPALQTPITVHRTKASQRRGYHYWAPTAKVSAGVLAGAATILLTAFLGPHWRNWTQQDMTPAVVTAITTIVSFVIQYWVPDRRT